MKMLYSPILDYMTMAKTRKESEAMFDKRMNEELVWVQLDLDTVIHDVSSHGLIIPILMFRSFFDQYMRICINWYQKLTPNVHKLPMISPKEREHASAIRTKV